MKISNKGDFAQAIKVVGGTKVVKPGKEIVVPDKQLRPISDEMLKHYRSVGVTFSKVSRRTKKADETDDEPNSSDDENAASDEDVAGE